MKKNKMMRIASILLVAALLSTCAISGTFAKYTTTSDASDTARVAYWGFTAEGTSLDLDLFDDTYGTTVDSANDDNVIAPGAEKTTTFSFVTANDATNKPEVSYTFTVEATGNIDAALENELVFELDGEMVGETGSFTELLAAIKALSGDETGTKTYGPGELPEAFSNGAEHTITWTWAMEGGDDAADTTLGNAAYDALAALNLAITVTATQITD